MYDCPQRMPYNWLNRLDHEVKTEIPSREEIIQTGFFLTGLTSLTSEATLLRTYHCLALL